MADYNDFGRERVAVRAYTDFTLKDGRLTAVLPPCAVAEIKL